jgi:hypothetical protein
MEGCGFTKFHRYKHLPKFIADANFKDGIAAKKPLMPKPLRIPRVINSFGNSSCETTGLAAKHDELQAVALVLGAT